LFAKWIELIDSFECRAFNAFRPFKLIGGIGKGRLNEKELEKVR